MVNLAEQWREFGIRPVPQRYRLLGFWDQFVLWADLGISFLVIVAGMFLVPGLGFPQALLAILVGALIGNALLGLAAIIGTDTRVPTMVLMRPLLGIRGSYLPTVLNILQLIGWATFEVIVMAQAANLLSIRLLHLNSYLFWVIFFSVLTTLMAVGGPIVVVKQWLEKFAVWAVLITTVWLTVAVLTSYDMKSLWSKPGTGELSFWAAVDLVIAMPISWFPLVADYSRFGRHRKATFWGTSFGYFVPHAWFYALGTVLALGAGVLQGPQAPIAPLMATIANLTAGWIALLVLLVDETDEGFANIYSTAVSVQNLFPKLSQRLLATLTGALVLVLAAIIPLIQYESFLYLIGSFFVPLLGLLAADYFLLRGGRYEVEEIEQPGGRYWYQGGFNGLAVGVWVIGVAVYLFISGVPALGIEGKAPWLGATLPSLVLSFLLYLALGRLVRGR